jgi:hypothetical protein
MLRDFFRFGFLRGNGRRPTGRRKAASHRPRVLELENRTLPSTVVWLQPVGGDWDTPANWAGGRVPISGDDAVIPFAGIQVTHATNSDDRVESLSSEAAINISAGSLTVTGGNLGVVQSRIDALVAVTGGTLSLGTDLGVVLNGTGMLQNFATLNFGHFSGEGTEGILNVAVDNEGLLTAVGEINNNAARPFVNGPGATLRVPVAVEFANGFTNQGDIELSPVSGTIAGLDVDNGTLVNAPEATIDFAGNPVNANLDNQGAIIGGAFFAKPGSTVTNEGTIIIPDSRASFNVLGGMFEQNGSISGPGTLDFTNSTATFMAGAVNDVGALVVVNSTLTSADALMNLGDIRGSTINAGVVNPGNLFVRGNTTINGPFTNAAGMTVTVIGELDAPANLTCTQGITNNGAIVLRPGTDDENGFVTLTVTGGMLTNAPDAAITVQHNNTGGAAFLNGALDNQGTLTILQGTDLTGTVLNSGTITAQGVQGGDLTVHAAGSAPAFVNTGTVTVGSLRALIVEGGDLANAGSVTVGSFGILSVDGNYTQTGGQTLLSAGILIGGSLVDLEGGVLAGTGVINASVLNNSEVDVGQPGSPGVLTIVGDYTQTAGGVLVIEIGGLNPGTDFDQLNITGLATLDGTLTVNLINGFVPNSGDSFTVMNSGSGFGTFATLNGDGPLFTPTFDSTDVTLVAN